MGVAMKRRILFNGHDFKFLTPVISHYQANPKFEVLIDSHPGHVVADVNKSSHMLNKADIIFCEWCLGNAEWYSQNKLPHQILIIRLHHQEIGLHFLEKINWVNVDKIIFICQNNMRLFLEKFPHLSNKSILIYNLFDCTAFDSPKLPKAEFNLGFIGTAPRRKAPHLAVDILLKLKQIDSRYTLFIKGKHPWEYDWLWRNKEERQYFETLYSQINNSKYANSIVFDPHGNDVPLWFSKIGFLLSTSEHEGSHQSVAEGMASGAIPVIRNWEGAELLYPEKFVFSTVDEAVHLIQKCKTLDNYQKESEGVKLFAQKSFNLPVIINQFNNVLRS